MKTRTHEHHHKISFTTTTRKSNYHSNSKLFNIYLLMIDFFNKKLILFNRGLIFKIVFHLI